MAPRSPEKLRKVTLNLFEADCTALERQHGFGWSEVVRALVRADLLWKQRIRGTIDTIQELRQEEEQSMTPGCWRAEDE